MNSHILTGGSSIGSLSFDKDSGDLVGDIDRDNGGATISQGMIFP